MKTTNPIKRSAYIQPFSRDHHHGLLLCWKIKTGLINKIVADRIKAYADWFYITHLLPHFDAEEKYIFPILGAGNELIKKALLEHARIKKLFEASDHIPQNLAHIVKELDHHIRFEERVLFNEIQACATPEQLESISHFHSEDKFIDNLTDPFWM
jgi:hemerythrin superfamily protein